MRSSATSCLAAATLAVVLSSSHATAQFTPPAHPRFEGDAVHTIQLTFLQPNWWNLLVANFEGQPDPLYLEAQFDWENVHYDQIGVRFKGHSSYNSYPGQKKPFKLKFDEYVSGQKVYGLDLVNLNNAFKDPSFAREKCFYELAAEAGLPASRANYAALYINGIYWGLYGLVEDVDQEYIESRFGDAEDGNLWKGDPRGTLEYKGSDPSAYYNDYELQTNTSVNDWTALVELIDALNNTPISNLADTLHPLMDTNLAMAMLAVNNLTVNLDSYAGPGHNHYLYHRESDDRFAFNPWDGNEAWGAFSMGMSIPALRTLSPLWLNNPSTSRPLGNQCWAVSEFVDLYYGHIRRLMAHGADPDTLLARMEELRDLVRPYVVADTQKMYSDQQFEDAMQLDISVGPGGSVPGLDPFIRMRHTYLEGQLGAWSATDDIVLNEMMAMNQTTIADEWGDYDDWIEIANTGTQAISLSGLTMSDDPGDPTAYAFPADVLNPGDHYIVWADDEPTQGAQHAPFKLSGDGESVYLYDGAHLIDTTTFHDLGNDEAYGRFEDGTGDWTYGLMPTPGAANLQQVGTGELFINEFLASNETTNFDESGDYDDWVELYNPGTTAVDLTGYHLTDDLSAPLQWTFPAVSIPADGLLLVWCDDEVSQGPLHANFKLGASGEEIALTGPDTAGNPLIDSYVFGGQTTDVSEGRESDGAASWVFFTEPTPEATNAPSCTSPLPYGIGKLNSIGTVPFLYYEGTPSASTNDLDLLITKAVPLKPVLAFYGQGRDQKPFMGGTLWTSAPFQRMSPQQLSGAGEAVYAIDIDVSMVGQTRNYMGWFRDPGHPSGYDVGLTNALEVVFCP